VEPDIAHTEFSPGVRRMQAKYVAGGLQAANKIVSLSPAYKTKYVPVRDNDGQWKSSVYFECHYFDVSLNPATGQPFWTAKSHGDLDGEAKKSTGGGYQHASAHPPLQFRFREAKHPMHALARGAARASGPCHHLSIFDAAWEIVYRVLRSLKERACAPFRRSGIKATTPPRRPHGLPSKVHAVLHGPNSMYQC
jgi:hypothetical protein